jgi:PPIC-type peptidyl-prolyl cis-trans isomerase-like protein
MQRWRAWAIGFSLFALGLATGFVAGGRRDQRALGPDSSATVATFRGGRITAAELRAAFEEQGSLARPDPAARRRMAQELVRQRLVEQDAVAKGYDRSPEAAREHRRALAALYVRGEVDEPAARRPITDADLQAWLDGRRAEFEQPERARIADLFVAASASGLERQKRLQEAKALLRDLQLRSARDYYAFATAARTRSDDLASKAFGGDLPLLSRPELEARLGPEVADAAFALRGNDVLADRVIETPAGFHLIKLRARVEATHADVASLRNLIRTRLAAERRTRAENDLYAALEGRAEIHLDEGALAAVDIPASAARASR